MAKKKTEEVEETVDVATETEVTEESVVEAKSEDTTVVEEATADDTSATKEVPAEKKAKKAPAKKAVKADGEGADSVIDSVLETVASAVETVTSTVSAGASALVSAVTGSSDEKPVHKGKRAEKIGVVASDKMTNTVTVRVDRLVKHPIYRKYIRKRKKFMAHDELGAKPGDKVRIVETRPLSARKRWRVVEIIQKAER
jgi:small subunit ribosomal protein S17